MVRMLAHAHLSRMGLTSQGQVSRDTKEEKGRAGQSGLEEAIAHVL